MKVVHLCLSCFYIDGFTYQENMLVRQHVADGHDVVVIASTENYGNERKLTYVEPSTYVGSDGARVIRLPYRKFLPHKLMRKLRMHPGVMDVLELEKPNAVLFHGLCGYELATAAQFKRRHPHIPVYADSHEDFNNSARTPGSRLLHKLYYKPIIRRSQPAFDKLLCISVDTMDFVHDMYGVDRDRLEFYPLGGTIPSNADYKARRAKSRKALGLAPGTVMLLQTGKMGRKKKLLESLAAFGRVHKSNLRLVLAGSLDPEIEPSARQAVKNDARISFLGWKDSDALLDLLCAADVYLQPGTQSATMQMSLCSRCPVILDDVASHRPFIEGNGWLIQSVQQLPDIFEAISEKPEQLQDMSMRSLAIASRMLDYKSLAQRVLH